MADFLFLSRSDDGVEIEKERPRVYEGRESEKETNPARLFGNANGTPSIGYPGEGVGVAGEPVEFRWRVEMSTLSWPFYEEVARK
jgi:hypothetical protein